MSQETDTSPREDTRTVPLVQDFQGALNMAIATRRGHLLKIGNLIPKAEQLTDEGVEQLVDLIARLIDEVGDRERKLSALREAHDMADEGIENALEALGELSQKAGAARAALRTARRDIEDQMVES